MPALCLFQVSSIISTTGFATADFCLWPQFSQIIFILLMLCGACAGSTGGGINAPASCWLAGPSAGGPPHHPPPALWRS